MKVLKVRAEGITTSFRHPLIMLQVHPTFRVPPPATIYGHICSALGEYFDAEGVQFAYRFRHSGEVVDLEHVFQMTRSSGRLPGSDLPKVQTGFMTPFSRELLFRPELTLYINRPDWEPAFRSPRYAVALGRSQDLCTYTSVEVADLEQREEAYFEGTLLPHAMALQVQRGETVLMPRYVDHEQNRRPEFRQYLVLEERVRLPRRTGPVVGPQAGPFWVDPTSPVYDGAHLGLAFHSFVGTDDAA